MTKKIYKANLKDICLLPSDVTLAMERAKEINHHSYRSRNRIALGSVIHPTLKDYDMISTKLDGLIIPKDNITARFYPDGVEQLTNVYKETGDLYAHLSYVAGGMRISVSYFWNITDAGIYAQSFDKNTIELEWR